MAKSPLSVVRKCLQNYADRGVFQGFSEGKTAQGLPAFKFVWLMQREMELSVDPHRHVLRFRQLLPQVPATSTMYADVKQFLSERHDSRLPPHRRVDRRRAEVSCSNWRGAVSLSLDVKSGKYAYGVNRIVNVVHELFVHLRDAYPDYLVENFDVSPE
jgi:hypothetical protein